MKGLRWRSGAGLLAAALGLGLPATATGETDKAQRVSGPPRQAPVPARPGTRISVAAGARYRASGIHTLLLGHTYRGAWTTPIPVEVLDLRSYEGGLRPVKKGGGMQTLSLTFEAADGRRYKFRSVDKDPGPILEPKLRPTLAGRILQDQISASYPGAPLVIDALSAAADIPYVSHRLVVLPDDDSLGEFRAQFAGQMGFLERVVDEDEPLPPGFEGVTRVVDTDKLEERMEADPRVRIDSNAFVKARLFDMFIGDWDRHELQWKWLQRGDGAPFQPYPVDRDQAFIHFDGLLPHVASGNHPMLVEFEPIYRNVLGLVWNSRVLDRRMLGGVERAAYREAARELQQSLTDEVIVDAVRRLPAQWFALNGQHFITALKGRRDRLPGEAEAFYRLMADQVDLHGTNVADSVEVRREEPGSLLVVMRSEGADEPLVQRRFKEGETREVRLYLDGGDDRVQTFGTSGGSIDLRVAGGPGDDLLDDSQGGGSGLYDHDGHNTVVKGPRTRVNTHYWVQPTDLGGFPLLDWGGSRGFSPSVMAGADLGVLIGAQWQQREYGFRRLPYASLQTVRGGYSTARSGWRLEYVGDFMHTASYREHRLRALVSNIELVRFYGFGNETPAGRPSDFFRAEQREYLLAPSYRWGSRTAGVWLGAVGKFSDSKSNAGRFLEELRPYGFKDFGQVGPQLTFLLDTRDTPAAATRGVRLEATGVYYPQVWSVERQFADTHAEVSTYLTPVRPLTLALRAGGKKVWGDRIPFHEAAFIGGPDTVRGVRRNRYAGDASAYGSVELRLHVGEVNVLVPLDVGVFGFGDIGRVFVEGQSSDLWHTGVGGGLSVAVLHPETTVTATVAWPGTLQDGRFRRATDGDNRARFYLAAGFNF